MKYVRPATIDDAVLVASNVTEDDYPEFDIAHTYGATDRVIIAAQHRRYESLVGSNVGHSPLTDDGTHWLDIGPTNRWTMFDGVVQSQTIRVDSIAVELEIPGRADCLGLFNVNAASLSVTLTDPLEGVVYDRTVSLVSSSGIDNWYAWFFEPVVRVRDKVLDDLPPYAGATLAITLDDDGGVAACGAVVVGLSKTVGDMQYGASLGITDYSVKQADDFGNLTIVERAYSNRASYDVFVPNGTVDDLKAELASFRATPILYIGSARFASTAIYGFYRDFTFVLSYPTYAVCSLELESLV